MSLTQNRYEVIKSNKYPLLITLIFLSCTFYVSFFIDNPASSGEPKFKKIIAINDKTSSV